MTPNDQAAYDRYRVLVEAVKIFDHVQYAVWKEQGTSSSVWAFVLDARDYIRQQATEAYWGLQVAGQHLADKVSP